MSNVNYDDFHVTTRQWFEQFKKKINLNCNDCTKSLQDCTCIEDTIDIKQETLEDVMLRKAEWRLGLI